MREILADLDRWQGAGEELALATLVSVKGSAPRLPGARLLMTRGGGMAGSVSGGCVETDVYERALRVLDTGAAAVAEYGIADELGFEVGLSCGGSIDVLIERFAADEAWTSAREALEAGRPGALAIGLRPAAALGRRLAVTSDGGTIGGIDAALDGEIVEGTRELMLEGGWRTVERGEWAAFVEAFGPPPRLLIVGATQVAISLSRLAKELGFRVTVMDARSVLATEERFPEADEIVRERPERALQNRPLDGYSYVVVLTHDPKFDVPVLERAARSEARYVGAMGSRSTHERRKAALRERGLSEEEIGRVRAPIGLDLGGRTAEETALSIIGEIVSARHGREGRPLSEGSGAIHGRI